jgi:hypothetical protein
MNQRLVHDHAFAAARCLVEIVATCLREEERLEAFREFYEVTKAAIESYEIHAERMRRRLKPSQN